MPKLVKKMSKKSHVVVRSASTELPTLYGKFTIYVYRTSNGREQSALVLGDVTKKTPLVRIHSQCLTGDTFGSLLCDCGAQLQKSLEIIGKEKAGVLVYLNQEGRGIGLTSKIKAYVLQHAGLDTVAANEALGFPADARDYSVAAAILRDLKIKKIRLLTNNPDKIEQIEKNGIMIEKRIPLEIEPTKFTAKYLKTKKEKMRHLLSKV